MHVHTPTHMYLPVYMYIYCDHPLKIFEVIVELVIPLSLYLSIYSYTQYMLYNINMHTQIYVFIHIIFIKLGSAFISLSYILMYTLTRTCTPLKLILKNLNVHAIYLTPIILILY